MRALFTERDTLASTAIRAREGGISSHCAVDLGDCIADATFAHGVRRWSRAEFLSMHRVVGAYQVELPDEGKAHEWWLAQSAARKRYDWVRIIGYLLWRTIGSSRAHTCEEFLWGGAKAGYAKLATGDKRTGVRLLHEWCAQRGRDVTHEYAS